MQLDCGQAVQSSAWRELRAVKRVLESFVHNLQNERVCWSTNNQNVVRIVLHGSKKQIVLLTALQQEALTIFDTSVKGRIHLEPE